MPSVDWELQSRPTSGEVAEPSRWGRTRWWGPVTASLVLVLKDEHSCEILMMGGRGGWRPPTAGSPGVLLLSVSDSEFSSCPSPLSRVPGSG